MRRPPLTRRGFIGSAAIFGAGAATGVGLPGCALTDLLPTLDDLEVGSAHLFWDISRNKLYRLYPEQHALALIEPDGTEIWRVGEVGEGADQLNFPRTLIPSGDGLLYVVDHGNDRIVVLDEDGRIDRVIGESGVDEGQLRSPHSVAVDGDGMLWVSDRGNHRLSVYEPNGSAAGSISTFSEDGEDGTLNAPRGMAFDDDGNVHVVDGGNARVQVFDTAGGHVRSYGGFGANPGEHFHPRSIAIAPTGNVFVSDPVSGVVQVYGPQGVPQLRFNSLSVGSDNATPLDISFNADGLLYVRAHTWSDEA